MKKLLLTLALLGASTTAADAHVSFVVGGFFPPAYVAAPPPPVYYAPPPQPVYYYDTSRYYGYPAYSPYYVGGGRPYYAGHRHYWR